MRPVALAASGSCTVVTGSAVRATGGSIAAGRRYNPSQRPAAKDALKHAYFHVKPPPQPLPLMPTFPELRGAQYRCVPARTVQLLQSSSCRAAP